MKTRIQKLIAEANVASRRAAEHLIEQGRVRVNGKVATLGDKADPETDTVEVDGERLKFDTQKKVYFALYKPRNVLTTSAPHRGDERKTVLDFVPYNGHLFTIGRLDSESEGLIVLTNDGELTHRLTHPRYRHTKTYKVTVQGLPSQTVLQRWENGIWLEEDGKTAPCSVSIVKGSPRETILRIIMTEGKKRQIRRVAFALGHSVERLVRTHIGMLSVENLRPGEWRELTAQDIKALSTPAPMYKSSYPKRSEKGNNSSAQSRRQVADESSSRRPRYSGDEGARESERYARKSTNPGRRHSDDQTREANRSRGPYGSDDERNSYRSSHRTSYKNANREHRSYDKQSGSDDRSGRPTYSSDQKHDSDSRPSRSSQTSKYGERRRSYDDQTSDTSRDSSRSRSFSHKSTNSRSNYHSKQRPPRRSSNTVRKPTSQNRRRSSNQGFDDE
jgi:pseudouridine synthase